MNKLTSILVTFTLLITLISCNKNKEENIGQVNITGEWKSEKRITWITITATDSIGVPQWLYYTPLKDTVPFNEENYSIRNDGQIYIEYSSKNNISPVIVNYPLYLNPDIQIYRDTVNYTVNNGQLTTKRNGTSKTSEIKTSTKTKLVLYMKEDYPTYKKEYWFVYTQ